jgi:hypothetical protein
MTPTIEQVREHAAKHSYKGGGLWLLRRLDWVPWLEVLRVEPDDGLVIESWNEGTDDWFEGFHPADAVEAIPCDAAGNPLPLVEERDVWKRRVMHESHPPLVVSCVDISLPEHLNKCPRIAEVAAERDTLRQRADKAEEGYRFMVERAADQKLDGYRELGMRAANAENALDVARARICELETQLEAARTEAREWQEEADNLSHDLAEARGVTP